MVRLLSDSSWRALAAELRQRGIPRRPGDTVAAMRARLHLADAAIAAGPAPLRIVPAITGAPAALDALAPILARHGGARIAHTAALVPLARLPALRRALRRRGHPLAAVAETPPASADVDPSLWAAARFVRLLADAQRWPPDRLPHALAVLPPPIDPAARRQADALLRAWTAALDAATDPLAEIQPEPPPTEPAAPPPGIAALLRRARDERRPVRILYAGGHRPQAFARTVEPLAITHHHGHAYLHAWCHFRADQRLFRIDRIRHAELLAAPSESPTDSA